MSAMVKSVGENSSNFAEAITAASRVRSHFNTRYNADKETMIEHYKDFLNTKLENSTIADLAMQDVLKKQPITHPLIYSSKQKRLEREPEVDELVLRVNNQYKENYPKTGDIRKTLIENDRVSLESIQPKATKLEKFILKLKSIV
jgi:hypothetical protein